MARHAPRDAAEFLADAGRLANSVEQNLRIEPPQQGPRIVLLVALVGGIRFRGELIGSRPGDRANQPVQIEVDVRQTLWPARRAIRGWTGDWSSGNRRPARRCRGPENGPTSRLTRQRASQGLSRDVIQSARIVAAVPRRGLPRGLRSQRRGRRPLRPSADAASRAWPSAPTTRPRAVGLKGNLREEGLHAVIVGLAPAVVGMMVALGARDADAQETPATACCRFFPGRHRSCKAARPAIRSATPRQRRVPGRICRKVYSRQSCRESSE